MVRMTTVRAWSVPFNSPQTVGMPQADAWGHRPVRCIDRVKVAKAMGVTAYRATEGGGRRRTSERERAVPVVAQATDRIAEAHYMSQYPLPFVPSSEPANPVVPSSGASSWLTVIEDGGLFVADAAHVRSTEQITHASRRIFTRAAGFGTTLFLRMRYLRAPQITAEQGRSSSSSELPTTICMHLFAISRATNRLSYLTIRTTTPTSRLRLRIRLSSTMSPSLKIRRMHGIARAAHGSWLPSSVQSVVNRKSGKLSWKRRSSDRTIEGL